MIKLEKELKLWWECAEMLTNLEGKIVGKLVTGRPRLRQECALLSVSGLFWLCLNETNVNRKLQMWEINDFNQILISDALANTTGKNQVCHSPLSYFNYLYNKYVLSLDDRTKGTLQTACQDLQTSRAEINYKEIIEVFKKTYEQKIKNSYFYNFDL